MLRSRRCFIPAPVQTAGSFDASMAATCWWVLGRIVLRSGVSKGSLGWGFGMGRQYAASGCASASVLVDQPAQSPRGGADANRRDDRGRGKARAHVVGELALRELREPRDFAHLVQAAVARARAIDCGAADLADRGAPAG